MTELTLRILFYGLIAFAPNRSTDEMTAYLVKTPAGDHCGHLAFLGYAALTCAPACPSHEGVCRCPLHDVDITFEQPIRKQARQLKDKPNEKLPSDKSASSDLAWLVRMAAIEERPAAPVKTWNEIQGVIGARLSFGWQSAQTCALSQRTEKNNEIRVHEFEFVDQRTKKRASQHEQAMADFIAFDSRIEVLAGRTAGYTLVLSPRGTTSQKPPVKINFTCPQSKCPDLWIVNRPADRTCGSEEFGDHFAAYSALTSNSKGLIPHLLPDSKPAKDVQPGGCSDLQHLPLAPSRARAVASQMIAEYKVTAGGRPICGMVMLDPASP